MASRTLFQTADSSCVYKYFIIYNIANSEIETSLKVARVAFKAPIFCETDLEISCLQVES